MLLAAADILYSTSCTTPPTRPVLPMPSHQMWALNLPLPGHVSRTPTNSSSESAPAGRGGWLQAHAAAELALPGLSSACWCPCCCCWCCSRCWCCWLPGPTNTSAGVLICRHNRALLRRTAARSAGPLLLRLSPVLMVKGDSCCWHPAVDTKSVKTASSCSCCCCCKAFGLVSDCPEPCSCSCLGATTVMCWCILRLQPTARREGRGNSERGDSVGLCPAGEECGVQ